MKMHKDLTAERWFKFSLFEQLSNIGADVARAIKWKHLEKSEDSECALFRALELLSLTIADPKNRGRLKEVVRLKEVLLDYFYGDNQYGYTDEAWNNYFEYYAYAAAAQKRSQLRASS